MATILNILSNLSNIHVARARLVCLYCTAAGLTNSPPPPKKKKIKES